MFQMQISDSSMLLETYFFLCGTFFISVLLALHVFSSFPCSLLVSLLFVFTSTLMSRLSFFILFFLLFLLEPVSEYLRRNTVIKIYIISARTFFLFLFKLFPPVETFWKAQLEGPVLVRFFPYFLPLVLIAHVCWFTMILICMHGDTVRAK